MSLLQGCQKTFPMGKSSIYPNGCSRNIMDVFYEQIFKLMTVLLDQTDWHLRLHNYSWWYSE